MKTKFSKILCMLLAAAMVMGLAACGSKGSSAPGKSPAETPTPDFIYTSTYKDMESPNKDQSIYSTYFTDDGFYYMQSVVVGQEIPEGAVIEYEGQYDVWKEQLYFMSYDGTSRQLTDFATLQPEEKVEGHEYYSYVSTLIESNGELWGVFEQSESWSDAPEGTEMWSDEWYQYYKYTDYYYLCKLNDNGGFESMVKLDTGDDPNNPVYYSFYSSVIDDQGRLITANDTSVVVFGQDGTIVSEIPNANAQWIDGIVKLNDGRIFIKTYGSSYELREVDIEGKSIGDAIELSFYPDNLISGGGDYDLYYTNGINFFGYDVESGESAKLFNWISCDVDNNNLAGYTVRDDGSIFGILNTWDENYENCKCEAVTVTRQPYDPSTAKKTLVLATQGIDWNVRTEIIRFNRSNPDFRIEVKDYSEYNNYASDDPEDYSAGLTKLTTEILAGDVPDIIDLNGMPLQQLASKGIIEDLYPYIDNDGALSREDFFPNVLAAYEYDGKLCSTCTSFYIQTLCGAASVVGDKPGWTLDQLKAALATMPEGCEVLSYYTTRGDIIYYLVGQTVDRFVDWNTGKCSFDSQDFVDILEFASMFPAEFNWDNYEYETSDDDFTRISQGRQMLMSGYFSSFEDMEYYNAAFGGDMTFIGYPTSSGNGAIMGMQSGYAISSSCSDKDAAWKFLRTFFTEEYQSGNSIYNYPSNINAFNAKLEKAMTPEYEKDVNGNYVLAENGEKIEISRGGMGMEDGTMINFYALSQEMADKLVDLINNTTLVMSSNEKVLELINAETDAYFSGQKSAEEVAKLIQNKVSLYVSEQS